MKGKNTFYLRYFHHELFVTDKTVIFLFLRTFISKEVQKTEESEAEH